MLTIFQIGIYGDATTYYIVYDQSVSRFLTPKYSSLSDLTAVYPAYQNVPLGGMIYGIYLKQPDRLMLFNPQNYQTMYIEYTPATIPSEEVGF